MNFKKIIITMLVFVLMLPYTVFAEGGSITDCPSSEEDVSLTADLSAYVSPAVVTYTGQNLEPAVIVHDRASSQLLIRNLHYTVTYKENKNVGTGYAVVTGMGAYEGESCKVYFSIAPKRTVIKAPKAGKGYFYAKWAKLSTKMSKYRITGYQVKYGKKADLSDAKKVSVKGYSKTSKKLTKLSRKTTYYVQVRTYLTTKNIKTGKNSTYYSEWSPVKTVVTK